MVNASIITIGDELLIGQVIDTNSAWIAQQLNKTGISVKRRVAVGDEEQVILDALNEESIHSDIILITGGLGPTSDDITKPLLCKYFNGRMIIDEQALLNVERLYRDIFKRPLTQDNIRQAEVPDTCIVIQNKRGTAPGMWFEKNNKIYISMPGVPYEMQGMITDHVIPELSQKLRLPAIVHRTLLTSGVGESIISGMLIDFEAQLRPDIKLAYLPSYGMVRLRLSSTGDDREELEKVINEQFELLKKEVKDYLVTETDETLSQVVGKLLIKHHKTLATAESCTGGYIAHLITSVPGSSAYFKGGIISYDNSIKSNLLKVSGETLENRGAVSESTVKEMVSGALNSLNTDVAIAVSGIMGPDGGSPDKPVGTVWIAVGSEQMIETKKLQLRFDRIKNIEITAQNALDMARKFIIKANP